MAEDPELIAATERQLEHIAEISRNVRATWFLLIGVLAFAGVTLLGVEDADFFAYGRQTSLPLVGVDIPTRSFFLAAPVLVGALYVYFHFQLRQLWASLAQVPRSALPLVYPGLLTDWGLRLRPDAPGGASLLDGLQRFVVFLLVWCATPVVLAGFWWRAMPAHEEWLTLANAAVLLLAIFAGYGTWGEARRRLRGVDTPRPAWRNLAASVVWSAVLATLVVVSWSRTEGGLDHYATLAVERWGHALPEVEFRYDQDADRWSSPLRPGLAAVANAMRQVKARYAEPGMWAYAPERLFVLAPVDLAGEPLVPRAENWRDHEVARDAFFDAWCARKGLRCAELSDDERAARDRAWAEERTATLASAPQLLRPGADLRGGNLAGAFAPAVTLREARLEGAILWGAQLEGENLSGARLAGANLSWARLEGARFNAASLSNARFSRSVLNDAEFEGVEDLVQAQLEDAIGNQNTRLPRDAETGEPLYVWSCLMELPEAWQLRWIEAEREAALCNGRPREKVGRLAE